MIIATGSEVPLALEAQAKLAEEGIAVRVVSMPSTTVFDRQDAAYRGEVLPRGVPRVAVEAGVTDYWRKYVGPSTAGTRGRRHRPFRRIGAGAGAVQTFRVHRRERRRGGEACSELNTDSRVT